MSFNASGPGNGSIASLTPATIDRKPGWPRTSSERFGVGALGLISGLDGIGYSVAIASLLFTGRLANGVGLAAGSALLCTAIVAIVVGVRTQIPTNIAHVQDVAVAVLAASFARSEVSVATAFAIVGASSLATGITFWLTGRLRLGRIVKYFPQAVLAGFLAGTGWLLLRGGVSVAVGYSPSLRSLGDTTAASIGKLLPAVLLAVCLYVAMRKFQHPVALLAVLTTALIAFYGWMLSSSMTLATAMSSGYLPRPSGSTTMQTPFPDLLSDVDWGSVARSTPMIITIAMLSLFAFLMNSAALERATGRDVDIDAELRDSGLANVVVAAAGGPPGYTGLSLSVLGDKAGVRHRGAGVITGIIVLFGFVFANQIVTHVPTFVSAGFIMFLGIDLLADWIVRALRTYSPAEAITVLVILGFVVFSGFLQATVAGFVVATLLFAFSYARVPIVRSVTSLANVPSTRERPAHEALFLRKVGEGVEVVRLQGYLFFGSSERIVVQTIERIANTTRMPLRALVLDMTLVPGIDAASIAAFDRVRGLGALHQFEVVLCGANQSVLERLRRGGVSVRSGDAHASLAEVDPGFVTGFDAIDDALQVIEGRLLATAPIPVVSLSFREMVARGAPTDQFDALISQMRRTTHQPGETIVRAGEPGDELLIVESGLVAVMRAAPSGVSVRLREMAVGAVVGDIGFSLGQARTADIVAVDESVLLHISRGEVDGLDPQLGVLLHRIISRALAEKVLVANRMTDQVKG